MRCDKRKRRPRATSRPKCDRRPGLSSNEMNTKLFSLAARGKERKVLRGEELEGRGRRGERREGKVMDGGEMGPRGAREIPG